MTPAQLCRYCLGALSFAFLSLHAGERPSAHLGSGIALQQAADRQQVGTHLKHSGIATATQADPSQASFVIAQITATPAVSLSSSKEDPPNRSDPDTLVTRPVEGLTDATILPPPYPPSPVIAGLRLDWATHRRLALGSDNFQTAWADDGHMYAAFGDGGGVGTVGNAGRAGLGWVRIEGTWNHFGLANVWGGFAPENPATFNGKSWGTIAVDGVLYSWVVPDLPDTGGPRDHYAYIELARSTDHAATWEKATWRWWCEDGLTIPTFLVFGQDNAGARDNYVYSYFIRPQDPAQTQEKFGLNVQRPGVLYLARVSKQRIFESREVYEWFAGLDVDGTAQWGDLSEKQPVLANPAGTGWCVSASYNAGLKRYLVITEHTASSHSLQAIYDAPTPWGPWTVVHYYTPGAPFGAERPGSMFDWEQNVFFLSFAPKWTSANGRDFTLVFTGAGRGKNNDSFNSIRGRFELHPPASVSSAPP